MAEAHVILSQTQYDRLISKNNNTDTGIKVNNHNKPPNVMGEPSNNNTNDAHADLIEKKPPKKYLKKKTITSKKKDIIKLKTAPPRKTSHNNNSESKTITNEHLIDKLTPPGIKFKHTIHSQKPKIKKNNY